MLPKTGCANYRALLSNLALPQVGADELFLPIKMDFTGYTTRAKDVTASGPVLFCKLTKQPAVG